MADLSYDLVSHTGALAVPRCSPQQLRSGHASHEQAAPLGF